MFRQYRKIERGEFFVIAGDCSQGGGDSNACQFISKTKLDVPLVYHQQGVAAQMTTDVYPVLEKIFDVTGVPPTVAFERNNGGASEMSRLEALNRFQKYNLFVFETPGQKETKESNKLGYDTTSLTRGMICGDLKNCIDRNVLRIYDKETIAEMFAFVRIYRAGKWQGEAEAKAHDDLIMSLAIGWQLYQQCNPPATVLDIVSDLPTEELFTNDGFY